MGPKKHGKRPTSPSADATEASRRHHKEDTASAAQPAGTQQPARRGAPTHQPAATAAPPAPSKIAAVNTTTVSQPAAGTQCPALQGGAIASLSAAMPLAGGTLPLAAATPTPAGPTTALPPLRCGFTQERLIGFMKDARYDRESPMYKTYFFKSHSDDLTRCKKCRQTIDEHPSESNAQSRRGWRIRCTLQGWRRVYDLRRRVTDLAQCQGARGTVAPSGMNIELDLWFQDDAKAAFFEKEINNAGSIILGEHEFAIPTFVEDDRADGEGPVKPYQRLDDDSPNKAVTHTTSTTAAKRRGELFEYQRIVWPPEVQEVHLIPQGLLRSGIQGTWMSVVADAAFNKWTDKPISLIDIDIAREGEARADGRTPVALRVSFRNNEPLRWEYLKMIVVRDAIIAPPPEQSLTVPISVRTEHLPLFRAVIAWRKASTAAVTDKVRRGALVTDNTNSAAAWYGLIPLADFPELSEFARESNSPPRKVERESLRSGEIDNDEYDSNEFSDD